MSGRSRPFDPRTEAIRGDLADVRLADLVFAPHYAAHLRLSVAAAIPLRATPSDDAEVIATLTPGEPFELLDVTGGVGWGVAAERGVVGYVAAASLEPAA